MTNHRAPLAPGEIRTHVVGDRAFQVMHVAAGRYAQATYRDGVDGVTQVLYTGREDIAIAHYAEAIVEAKEAEREASTPATTLADDQCGCERNPLGHLRSEHPTALPAEESWKHPYAERNGRCGTCGFDRSSDRHSAPVPQYVGFASGDEPGAPLCVNPRCGKRVMWDGERHIHTNGEVRCYRTVMGEAPPPSGQPAPAPTLADDVVALRAELEVSNIHPARLRGMLAILDRIAARAPQRARATEHESWWLHACGYVELHYDHHGTPAASACMKCDEVGAWQALYVLPDGA